MQSKIESLIEIYKNNKGKYLFDDVDNLEFDENGNINISLSFANDKYHIFIFLLNENKIIFKGLYMKSSDNLSDKYADLKQDLENLSFNEFVDKYYDYLLLNQHCPVVFTGSLPKERLHRYRRPPPHLRTYRQTLSSVSWTAG